MAKKSVWLTWMPIEAGAPSPQAAVQALDKTGFAVTGAPWVDAPKVLAWSELAQQLKEATGPEVWVIAARRQDLANADHRFGLAMTAALLRADRSKPPHIVLLGLDGLPDVGGLPTLLQSCLRLDGSGAGWPAKLLVATMAAASVPAEPFRLRCCAHKMFGLWLEVGPASGSWRGATVGVAGAKISNHAVGPRGGLPDRTVLEYQLEGLELDVAGATFHAFAVQNQLTDADSYYVKVDGRPSQVLLGQHLDVDAEVAVLTF